MKRKNKTVTYQKLRDCYTFRFEENDGSLRIFTKVSDSFALDERTGKDRIFALYDKVEPLYPVPCSLI